MVQSIPKGLEGVIPHLVVDDCVKALAFYEKAFGAKNINRAPGPDGKKTMHASMEIDGAPIFLADDFPEFGPPRSPKALGGSCITIHRYVKDCDAAVKQAVDAGATVKMPPNDAFWGDRYAIVTDPFGHEWSLATHIKDLTPDEMMAAMSDAFAQQG